MGDYAIREAIIISSREDRIVRLHGDRCVPRLEELSLTNKGWRSDSVDLDPDEWTKVFQELKRLKHL